MEERQGAIAAHECNVRPTDRSHSTAEDSLMDSRKNCSAMHTCCKLNVRRPSLIQTRYPNNESTARRAKRSLPRLTTLEPRQFLTARIGRGPFVRVHR